MKPSTHMHCALIMAGLAVAAATSVLAETVIVESRSGGQNLSYYAEGTGNWANSSVKSSAAGTTTGIGSRFCTTASGAYFRVSPVLPTAGGTYTVEVTHPVSANIPTDLMVDISVTGGSGLPPETTSFNQADANVWRLVGTLVLDPGVTTPTITFTKRGGSSGTGQRFYTDAIRFVDMSDPCRSGLPELSTVNGPLAAGQTFVEVPGIDANATAVVVYADGAEIGRKTTGVAAGVNRVTTGALVKGQVITVTQINPVGVESCRPNTGPIVGGGPNPSVRVALNLRQDASLNGPIGGNGGTAATVLKFLGATNFISGYGTAPDPARTYSPSAEWTTVSFQIGADPMFTWSSVTDTTIQGKYAVLDAIAFAIDAGDPGPYEIYIDDLKNGDTLIQGFEEALPGESEVQFLRPGYAGATTPYLLSKSPGTVTPNISMVTNLVASSGAQSLFVNWQFKDGTKENWLRLFNQGSGKPNSIIDVSQPISFRMLLLPVGQAPVPSAPVFAPGPVGTSTIQAGRAQFRANVRGTSPMTYQWTHNGVAIPGATNFTYQLTNAQAGSAGAYSVVVANALGTNTSPAAYLTVTPLVFSQRLTPAWSMPAGSRPYLTNDNRTRGLAYNIFTDNLLLGTTQGSNAVLVLTNADGGYSHTLDNSSGTLTGGTLALSKIASPENGSVYACNFSDNPTSPTDRLRIYRWMDDNAGGVVELVWEGDPGAGQIVDAWGGSMAARTTFAGTEIILGAKTNPVISIIYIDLGTLAVPVVVNVANAAAGSFAHGLAFGASSTANPTIWGKGFGLPLLEVSLDLGSMAGTILHSYQSLPNVGPIAVDLSRNLLAGISLETPDNLRLYAISNLNAEPVLVDTEFFPTDNANPESVGAVVITPDKVVALNSANGLLAWTLSNLSCSADSLSIVRKTGEVEVMWTNPAMRLQSTSSLGTPGTAPQWSDVSGSTSATVPSTTGNLFFRLVCP